ncbi:hypothetical protein [Subtercola lobariae]|uniref:Uncharacterized protein n=1 Tax=Subtercola lobariae TaxID=1588641 RepID=A0A917EX37_9MICO|nr:hypothetical protein [Subtercola lobariae]GGF29510.1 hypothetical protein GCM10011399_23350 [Subtercola lobariae]
MKRISYSGGSFLTTDSVAGALLHFVAALGSSHRAEAIEIPVLHDDGREDTIQLVIGPASELVSVSEATSFAEPDSSAAVENLHKRTESLAVPRPVAADSADSAVVATDYDFDDL